MLRTTKKLLVIWSILLSFAMVCIFDLEVAFIVFDIPVIGIILLGLMLLLWQMQVFLLPQVITVALNVLYIIGLYRDRYVLTMKKEIPQYVVLAIWSIAGTICCFIWLLMLNESHSVSIA